MWTFPRAYKVFFITTINDALATALTSYEISLKCKWRKHRHKTRLSLVKHLR